MLGSKEAFVNGVGSLVSSDMAKTSHYVIGGVVAFLLLRAFGRAQAKGRSSSGPDAVVWIGSAKRLEDGAVLPARISMYGDMYRPEVQISESVWLKVGPYVSVTPEYAAADFKRHGYEVVS
ncbi:MAG: hypothetical protein KAJ42_07385 [Gemmatimonadetes bacterium]|nr:hypothetical protein [Gemmatimonadota bacterium]